MKRIVSIILAVLLLTACGSTQQPQPVQTEEAPRFTEDHVATKAEFEESIGLLYEYEVAEADGYTTYTIHDQYGDVTIAIALNESGGISTATCVVDGEGVTDARFSFDVLYAVFPGKAPEELQSALDECGCTSNPSEQKSGAAYKDYAILAYDAEAHSFVVSPNER